ncbi:Alpha/Beta hydrolase protein [Leucosporidium creatinivorum]|uniref:Alpha/Beta hydrolase protein n=1 Tax=Leucosporidium creatinivorum TaxID=106004 RepID=A0A1Y2ETZ3_9BASI|nr:Alpha/Beta hydrolase protein [Leucosporidium creatinivorum]
MSSSRAQTTTDDPHGAPETDHPRLRDHAAELAHLSSVRQSLMRRARRSLPIAFLNYILQSVASYLRTLFLSPSTIFFDPLSTIASIVIYPVIFLFLFLAVVFLWIASLLGLGRVMRAISNKWANGYSIINWPNPDLFSSQAAFKTVQSARATLAGCATTFPDAPAPGATNVDLEPGLTTRIFDLDVAKTFLMMSALVYERRDGDVVAASDIFVQDKEAAEVLLLRSEQVIRDQAAHWNLRYEGISDLASTSGPFASIFYSQEGDPNPFIVLCFKGTTPTNFAEFLVDATISRVSSAVFFGDGTAHQGFYTDLFPTTEGGADGYGQITRSLRHVASEMTKGSKTHKAVPLWVTGHSLGSALASLIYARYLRMPSDLGDKIQLRDCYTYGTPRLGDGTFVSKYEESTCTPLDRPNIFWRIINHWDIVCQIPPGLADNELNRAGLSALSVLNYGHIGASLRLNPWTHPFYTVQASSFHSATRVVVVKEGVQGPRSGSRWNSISGETGNPLRWILMLLPTPVWNHFPASYYTHLDEIHVDGQGGEARLHERKTGAARKINPSLKAEKEKVAPTKDA